MEVTSWFSTLITIVWTRSWHPAQAVPITVSIRELRIETNKSQGQCLSRRPDLSHHESYGMVIWSFGARNSAWLAETEEWDRPTEKNWETKCPCFPKVAPGSSSFRGPVTPCLAFRQILGLLKLVFPIYIHKSGSHCIFLQGWSSPVTLICEVSLISTAPGLNLRAVALTATHLEFTSLILATLFHNHDYLTLLCRRNSR